MFGASVPKSNRFPANLLSFIKNRFNIVVMITNQKSDPLQLFSIFLMLLSGLISYGQWGEIIKIEQNEKPLNSIEIEIVKPDGEQKRININKKISSRDGSRIDD